MKDPTNQPDPSDHAVADFLPRLASESFLSSPH
jgi:hypothetical protein